MRNVRLFDIGRTLFIVSIVLSSGSVFNILYSGVVTSVLVLSVILLLIENKKTAVPKNIFALLVAVGVFLIFQSVVLDVSSIARTIKIIIKMILIFLGTVCLVNKQEDIFKSLYKILFVITVPSFLVYLFIAFGVPVPEFYIPEQNYYSILFLNVRDLYSGLAGSGIRLPRNFGVFWEPGLYQIFLNLLLGWQINKDERNIAKEVFIIINIALTFSPTGYLTAMFLYATRIALKKRDFKVILSIIGFSIVLALIMPKILEFLSFKATTDSYSTRMTDFILGFQTFIKHPIIGVGIEGQTYQNAFYSLTGRMHGNTNGLIRIAMDFGIAGLLFYIRFFCLLFKKTRIEYSMGFGVAVIVWLVCSLINEPIHFSALIMFLMAYAFCNYANKTQVEREL